MVPFVLLAFIIIIGPDVIAQTLYDVARNLAELQFGWLILTGLTSKHISQFTLKLSLMLSVVITSFPPMIGFTTLATLCGFAYGLKGFAIVGPGAIVGSAIVFVVLRLVFRKRVRRWTSENEKWMALEAVIVSRR